MIQIEILNALGDNYIYLVEYLPGVCFVVDPGDAKPVLAFMKQRNLKLTHIFATHYHLDHIGGIGELKKTTGCKVIGADSRRIDGIDILVQDGDIIELGEVSIRCIATPGHTSTSVCYFVTGKGLDMALLFTGDTLFICGCGRLLECDGQTMFNSLQKLAALPDETLVYPGHDYTEENLRFALTIEPNSEQLKNKLADIQYIIRQQHPRGHGPPYTVPSKIAEEKQLNPFLKAKTWQDFAELRKKKDIF